MKNIYTAIIPAAGKSTRFQTDKLLVKLNKIHLIKHAVDVFINDDDCDQIIIVTNNKNYDLFKSFFHLNKKILLVKGSDTRFNSVKNGFDYVRKDIEKILIHDAARPFLTNNLLDNIKYELFENNYDCVIPIINIPDSILKISNDKNIEYQNRDCLKLVQTPQAFKKSLLANSYTNNDLNEQFNDEFSFILKFNNNVNFKLIDGELSNKKITYPKDLNIE